MGLHRYMHHMSTAPAPPALAAAPAKLLNASETVRGPSVAASDADVAPADSALLLPFDSAVVPDWRPPPLALLLLSPVLALEDLSPDAEAAEAVDVLEVAEGELLLRGAVGVE